MGASVVVTVSRAAPRGLVARSVGPDISAYYIVITVFHSGLGEV